MNTLKPLRFIIIHIELYNHWIFIIKYNHHLISYFIFSLLIVIVS
jgi:hypothetical protein